MFQVGMPMTNTMWNAIMPWSVVRQGKICSDTLLKISFTWEMLMHEEEGWARSDFFSDKARAGRKQARVVSQGRPLLHSLLASQQHSLCCPYLSA